MAENLLMTSNGEMSPRKLEPHYEGEDKLNPNSKFIILGSQNIPSSPKNAQKPVDNKLPTEEKTSTES